MTQLAPGNYKPCPLVEAVYGASSKGTPQWALTFNVDGNNRTVSLYCSDAAIERTIETMQTLGFNGSVKNPQFAPEVYDPGIELYCKHEEYEGKTQEKWNISSGFKPAPATTDQENAFTTQWKARVGAPKPAAQKPGQAPPSRTPPTRTPPTRTVQPVPLLAKNNAECYTYVSEKRKDLTDDIYFKGIEEVEKQSKRVEADFTEKEWHEVASLLTLPEAPF